MIEKDSFDHRLKIKSKRLNRLPPHSSKSNTASAVSLGRFPKWLHRSFSPKGDVFKTNAIVDKYKLNTVCEEAKCPNRIECYSKRTAAFLALGKSCTRACGFCDIDHEKNPSPPEADEPTRIAKSIKELNLEHVVITMVTRDDLPDYGANHMARVIRETRKANPEITVEVLTSDFSGDLNALDIVLKEAPEVFNHNIETVRSLTPRIRHKATYDRTLMVLKHAKKTSPHFIKSGIMVGLGESEDEVKETIVDLHQAGCDIITVGHYLQANHNKLTVKNFVSPEQFKSYQEFGEQIGVKFIYSSPFVRASFNALHFFKLADARKKALIAKC